MAHDLIRGCMIDGLGRFEGADYRRSWLFFGDVTYVLPPATEGPLVYPQSLSDAPDFTVDRSVPDGLDGIAARAIEDSTDAHLIDTVSRMNKGDSDYARLVVWSDPSARSALRLQSIPPQPLAVAFLLNKLMHYADTAGAIPLVGQPTAAELIAWKVQQRAAPMPWKVNPATQRASFAAFAAGVSFGFVEDEDLMAVPVEQLARFKEDHAEMLEASQRHILEVAVRFAKLPSDSDFAPALASLKMDALTKRTQLDDLARQAWRDAGLSLLQKGFGGVVAAFAGGLVLAGVPAAVGASSATALSAIASEAVGLAGKLRALKEGQLAYLFRLGDLSLEARLGLSP